MPIPVATPTYRDLSEWVVLKILESIKDGIILPGERIAERDIAQRFGVSRAPVRDAIHELDRLGIVSTDRRGTYIRSWTDADLEEIDLIVDSLNLLAVRICIGRLRPQDLSELEQIIHKTEAAAAKGVVSPEEQHALELEFHQRLAELSGIRRIVELLKVLTLVFDIQPTPRFFTHTIADTLRHHKELLEHLRGCDLEGAVIAFVRHDLEEHSA